MIHTKELRYGNKVQTQDGEIITVQQILSNVIVYDTQIEVSGETVNAGKSYNSSYVAEMTEVIKEVDYQEINPIVLTPEILKKCGFRNFLREEWIVSIGNSHIDFVFIEGALRLRCPSPSLANIKYLHQLQNLIFAISTRELEIESITD
jgi:hypothetical protein